MRTGDKIKCIKTTNSLLEKISNYENIDNELFEPVFSPSGYLTKNETYTITNIKIFPNKNLKLVQVKNRFGLQGKYYTELNCYTAWYKADCFKLLKKKNSEIEFVRKK
jgi:hypothetical protein